MSDKELMQLVEQIADAAHDMAKIETARTAICELRTTFALNREMKEALDSLNFLADMLEKYIDEVWQERHQIIS